MNPEKGEALAEVKKENLSKLPINTKNNKIEEKIISLVDQILTNKSQNPSADTSPLESQIDKLVYQLYDLSEEEIAIVEASTK